MKKKTINAVISKKVDEWVNSIQDEKVKFLASQHTIVTGGCIASMLLKEQVNDFDVYFTNKETVKAIAEYYVNQFNDANGTDGYVLDGAEKNELNPDQKGGAALNMTDDRVKIIFTSDGVAKEEGADVDDNDEKEAWLENPTESPE